MQLSYSAIKEFDNCPRRFQQTKVLKIYPQEDTEYTLYGKEVHKACEEYIRDGKPLGGHSRFKDILDKMIAFPGTKHCELEMALDASGQAVGFDDERRVLRGIADLVIVNDKLARCVDWKTGSAKYPDPKQLELMALMIFAKFPSVMTVKGALIFLLHDVMVTREYTRDQFTEMFSYWTSKRDMIMICAEQDSWVPKPSGLCPYCPHKTCEFWKPKRR